MLNSLRRAEVLIQHQQLKLWQGDDCLFECDISTAKNGVGCVKNSGCTPTGQHYVRARIGEGADLYSVLKGRRATGEFWSPELAVAYPDRDWILGRILWLCGLHSGFNRGGQVDTFQRYIYIHGSPEGAVTGVPESHGCIRVKAPDMLRVFDFMQYGDRVDIAS